jgi:hypothetical protein
VPGRLLLANGVPFGATSLLEMVPLGGAATPGLVPFGVGTDFTMRGAAGVTVGTADAVVPGGLLLANGVPFGATSLLEMVPLAGAATPGLVPLGVGTDCAMRGGVEATVGAVDGVASGPLLLTNGVPFGAAGA